VDPLPATYHDEEYVAELRRRATLIDAMFEMEFMVPELEAVVSQALSLQVGGTD